jgi:hypothetical protein
MEKVKKGQTAYNFAVADMLQAPKSLLPTCPETSLWKNKAYNDLTGILNGKARQSHISEQLPQQGISAVLRKKNPFRLHMMG